MIDEILIRFHGTRYEEAALRLQRLITEETDLDVKIINHTDLPIETFDLQGCTPISIDQHLSTLYDIPYVRVSRRFNRWGDVTGRLINLPDLPKEPLCVIDTDSVSGETLDLAQRLCNAQCTSVAIALRENQDLIDVEDLFETNSLLNDGSVCSYLVSDTFFARRTSLPIDLYGSVRSLVEALS